MPLDRELRSQYDVVVEASDGAVDPRRTALTLSVLVTDVDDNSPVFTQETYVVSVPENSPVGTVVLKLSVSTLLYVFILFLIPFSGFIVVFQHLKQFRTIVCQNVS